MINTVNIKKEQLTNTYFKIDSGKEKVLIMGSCRVAPYVEYFHQYNLVHGEKYTIYSLDPFNHNWDINDNRIDYASALQKLETDERLLEMLSSVDIFIHEWYQNAGLFNVSKEHSQKTIYDFGMTPKQDICVCNFNDYFILVNDIVSFDIKCRKEAIQDYNVTGRLSDATKDMIRDVADKNIKSFLSVCDKSDIREMREYFLTNFLNVRLWHSYNHVSKYFTLAVFKFLNDKFLHLNLSNEFWSKISKEDLFANSFTPLCEYDIEFYGYQWGEPIIPLRNKLF